MIVQMLTFPAALPIKLHAFANVFRVLESKRLAGVKKCRFALTGKYEKISDAISIEDL